MSYWRKTRTKIMTLLVVTICVFACVFLSYQYIKDRQAEIFNRANRKSKALVVDNILKFKSKSYFGTVNDNACWDEMVEYVNHPTPEWPAVNVSVIEWYGFSNTWILDKRFNLVYSDFDSAHFKEDIRLSRTLWTNAFKKSNSCHFYLVVKDSILEVFGATIVSTEDTYHKTKAQGYFIAAKFWSKEYIHEVEHEMDLSINFRLPADTLPADMADDSKISVSKVLKDAIGNEVMIVDFTSKNEFATDISSSNKLSYALVGLLALTFVVFFYCIRRWISVPLTHITKSLSSENEQFVAELGGEKSEFGEIARLIKKFFEQKKHLHVEIAERIESQQRVSELYENMVSLNHELQASEEELTQNLEVTMDMNVVLSRQQREITDSINYASRIQAALLPPLELLGLLNRDYFILYKPHSIVSGDFYWISKYGNKIVLAVGDCTGHGVPGGFMSMLGMAYLSEIVNKRENLKANEILELLRKRVVESLHQASEYSESKDGMDIALCIFDLTNLHLQFSGAHNPLYILRDKSMDDGSTIPEFIEIKGDRMPVGFVYDMNNSFTNHEVSLYKNDMLYLFTDGYKDQMSSVTMQKFKRARLNDLLLRCYSLPASQQKALIDDTFERYRANYRQVDDVLVFGMRI